MVFITWHNSNIDTGLLNKVIKRLAENKIFKFYSCYLFIIYLKNENQSAIGHKEK
jgi:hypothetical protein